MAFDIHQNFVYSQYLENKSTEFHQILYMYCVSFSGRQAMVECVKSLTAGCNPIQIQSINYMLEDKLEDIEVTETEACEYNLPGNKTKN